MGLHVKTLPQNHFPSASFQIHILIWSKLALKGQINTWGRRTCKNPSPWLARCPLAGQFCQGKGRLESSPSLSWIQKFRNTAFSDFKTNPKMRKEQQYTCMPLYLLGFCARSFFPWILETIDTTDTFSNIGEHQWVYCNKVKKKIVSGSPIILIGILVSVDNMPVHACSCLSSIVGKI